MTLKILDLLDDFKIKAAFFLVGSNIQKFPQIACEINKRGHLIGNHSFYHQSVFAFRSADFQKLDARKTEDQLSSIGIERCVYFRPPHALCSNNTLKALGGHYVIVGTNHYIFDHAIFSCRLIVWGVLNSIKNRGGGIITLHDGVHPFIAPTRKIIVEASQILLPMLLSQGYQFCSLTDVNDSNGAVINK